MKAKKLLLPLLLSLSACETQFFSLNNVALDTEEHLKRNPELAAYLEQRKIPQDDRFHFSGKIKQLKDRQTGVPIGWEFDVAVRCAWPRVVMRPTPTPNPSPQPDDEWDDESDDYHGTTTASRCRHQR